MSIEMDLTPGTTPQQLIDASLAESASLCIVGADSETFPIEAHCLAPRLVCVTMASGSITSPEREIFVSATPDILRASVEYMVDPARTEIFVFCNAAFDLCVFMANYPDLIPDIFAAIEAGRFRCVKIRDKMLAVATTGNIDFGVAGAEDDEGDDEFGEEEGEDTWTPTTQKRNYSQADIEKRRLGIDRTEEKKGEDSWRKNYYLLADTSLAEWPAEAVKYACDDSTTLLPIHELQEEDRRTILRERGYDPLPISYQNFRVMADVCLYLHSCRGTATDAAYMQKVIDWVNAELSPEKLNLLTELGILRPAIPSRPHAKGVKDKATGQVKMTKAKPASRNMAVLYAYIEELAAKDTRIRLVRTKPSEKFPNGQVSATKGWRAEHAQYDPVIAQYDHRQNLQKLVTNDIPRMCLKDENDQPTVCSPILHPNFDVLKRTFRVSSFGSKMYPSFNCQQPHPKVRGVIVPRPGYLLCSIDYSFMELVTWAQVCYWLLGQSRLMEVINAGKDPHAWLGSQICLKMDQDFVQMCKDNSIDVADQDKVYDLFVMLKKCGTPEWESVFKKYRTWAKPTGLGYPGGLGAETFIAYSKATFQTDISLEEATSLREIWRDALPEARLYFEKMQQMQDTWNKGPTYTDKFGNTKQMEFYFYRSPMGMIRVGCDYCAAANGGGLQTPGAEGALLGLIDYTRACYDHTRQSILFNAVKPLMFLHDENICEIPDDEFAHERACEIGARMVQSFRQITPDVAVKAQPVLMRRWDKAAEPVFDKNGRLIPWEPKVA